MFVASLLSCFVLAYSFDLITGLAQKLLFCRKCWNLSSAKKLLCFVSSSVFFFFHPSSQKKPRGNLHWRVHLGDFFVFCFCFSSRIEFHSIQLFFCLIQSQPAEVSLQLSCQNYIKLLITGQVLSEHWKGSIREEVKRREEKCCRKWIRTGVFGANKTRQQTILKRALAEFRRDWRTMRFACQLSKPETRQNLMDVAVYYTFEETKLGSRIDPLFERTFRAGLNKQDLNIIYHLVGTISDLRPKQTSRLSEWN